MRYPNSQEQIIRERDRHKNQTRMSAHHFAAGLFTILSLFLPMFAGSHPCSEGFQLEAEKRHMKNCKKKILGAEFGWNYYNATRTLDILFGARLDSEMGWLAWGVNPEKEAQMVGTRAFIGIKQEDQTLVYNTYNVTHFTKLGCGLQPSKNIDLGIRNFSFSYERSTELYIIEASIVLPPEYNISRMNIVWQIGKATAGMEPMMHPHKLANFDSKETMDLISGSVVSDGAHPREKLRKAHGILNIVGWGTLSPIGVIIVRYCRKHPVPCQRWFQFHVFCQILGWALGTIGWILGIVLGNASKHYGFRTHRILAIIIFTFTTLQMFALRLKPSGKDEYRIYWNMYHHFLGYALLAIISANIFQGIAIISTDHTWKWAYLGLLGLLGLIALSLECYTWIKFSWPRNSTRLQVNNEQPKEKPQTSQISQLNQNASQPNESRETTGGTGSVSQLDRIQPSSSSPLQRI